MGNRSLKFKNILVESLLLSLMVFPLYGINQAALVKYFLFVIIGIPTLFVINWILIKLIQTFTNWKEVEE